MGAALAFGTALSKALGDRKGIHRFGNFSAPLDEALVNCVLVSLVGLKLQCPRSAEAEPCLMSMFYLQSPAASWHLGAMKQWTS